MSYNNSCEYGDRFTNNCAHFLSNWMIKNNDLSPNSYELIVLTLEILLELKK